MMKTIPFLVGVTLTLVLLSACAAVPDADNPLPAAVPKQDPPPIDAAPPAKSHGLAKARYSDRLALTEVSAYATISPRPTSPADKNGLELFIYFTSPGHTVNVPPAIRLGFDSTSSMRLFESEHGIEIAADDRKLFAGDCLVVRADCTDRGCNEALRGPLIPIRVLRQVATAKTVTLRIGTQTYELSADAQKAIGDILAIGKE